MDPCSSAPTAARRAGRRWTLPRPVQQQPCAGAQQGRHTVVRQAARRVHLPVSQAAAPPSRAVRTKRDRRGKQRQRENERKSDRDIRIYTCTNIQIHINTRAERPHLSQAAGAALADCRQKLRARVLRSRGKLQLGMYVRGKSSSGGRVEPILNAAGAGMATRLTLLRLAPRATRLSCKDSELPVKCQPSPARPTSIKHGKRKRQKHHQGHQAARTRTM